MRERAQFLSAARAAAVLLAAAVVVYAVYSLVVGMQWSVVSEIYPGGSPTRTTVRLPHYAAVEPLVAAALVLVGLVMRRLLLAWIGAAALLMVAGLLIFSIGLPLLPAAGLLLIVLAAIQVLQRGEGQPAWDWFDLRAVPAGRAWGVVAVGVVLMLLSPPVLWSHAIGQWVAVNLGVALSQAMVFGGLALFALGWLVTGAGLRPQGSARRGAVLAAALCLALGVLWMLVYVVVWGNVSAPLFQPTLLLLILLWPWHVAFMLGLFGMGPQ